MSIGFEGSVSLPPLSKLRGSDFYPGRLCSLLNMPAFTGHTSGLDTLASSGSCHRAKAAAFRCMSGSSRCRLTRPNVGDPLPSLHGHYTRFITTTEQSAPLRRIGTFGLAVGAACAFSLGIAGQVLTFRTRAWLSFAPSTCRMPLGPYQDIPRADPAGRVTPRF